MTLKYDTSEIRKFLPRLLLDCSIPIFPFPSLLRNNPLKSSCPTNVEWGKQAMSSFMHQYLEKGTRYVP